MISKITAIQISAQDYLVFNMDSKTQQNSFNGLIDCLARMFPEHKDRMIAILGDGNLSVLGDKQLKAIGLMRIPK